MRTNYNLTEYFINEFIMSPPYNTNTNDATDSTTINLKAEYFSHTIYNSVSHLNGNNGFTYGEVNVSFQVLSTDSFSNIKFKLYPNPAKDFISIDSGSAEISSAAVYNILGKSVLLQNKKTNNQIDVSTQNKGVYILRIQTDEGSTTKKTIIE